MRFFGLFVFLVLSACATAYQPQGLSGGFSETQLSENTFKVNFKGNGYTSNDRAFDFSLLRAAELMSEKNYKYFIIGARQNDEQISYSLSPTQSQSFVNVNSFGNSAYGTATTFNTGGDLVTTRKPRSSLIVIGENQKPKEKGVVFFETEFIIQSIKEKYKINDNNLINKTEAR